jgi:hypothetical protein
VVDANDRIVMRYDYDMLGNHIHQASMEAGERWMLNDVAGKPLYAWDSRNHQFHTGYDPLRRPTDVFLSEGGGAELRVGRTAYGETQPNPEANNLRGKVFEVFDQAGVLTSDEYDFKGNLLASRRQLAREYKAALDWSAGPALELETFTTSTTYDALNRAITVTAPDGSVYRPAFNEANLLERVQVNLPGSATATSFVTNIDYDAKGQRQLIEYGNGASTSYEYDPDTFRIIELTTTRQSDGGVLQGLKYTYDPAGTSRPSGTMPNRRSISRISSSSPAMNTFTTPSTGSSKRRGESISASLASRKPAGTTSSASGSLTHRTAR